MITKMKSPTAIVCVILLLLAGSVGTYLMMTKDAASVADAGPAMDNHTENYTTAYQFANMMGSGHGTNDTINMTHAGNMTVWINVTAYFHEPLVGEQGYVRVILMDNNTEIFNNQTSDEAEWYNVSNLTQKNLTVLVQSVGSDGTLTGAPVADWYSIQLTAYVVWELEE
jgi:hypothetical protein